MLILMVGLLLSAPASGNASIEEASRVGKKVAGFQLRDHQGKEVSLADFANEKVVVVIFLGTECPLVKQYLPRLAELHNVLAPKGVEFIGVNSNAQDTLSEIGTQARAHFLRFPVLKDRGTEVADLFGASRTPEAFVLDQDRVIRYQGRIDDQFGIKGGANFQRSSVGRRDLAIAIQEILVGKAVSQSFTQAPGCLIGRPREPKGDGSVTYSNQISRIFQKHCVECHRPGNIGPFPMERYEDVVGWGDMIEEVVREQRMPPWHADEKHGKFSNEARLSAEEKSQLAQWVKDGCPEGDESQLPPQRKFVQGWNISKPDIVFAMDRKAFRVPAEGTLGYKHFLVKTGFQRDMWIKAAECRPGNRSVVHHIIVFIKPPGKKLEAELLRGNGFLTATAPGAKPLIMPPGVAKRIPAGSDLVFQMHYTPNGVATSDRSEVGLVFAQPSEIEAEARTDIAGNFLFAIPAGAPNHELLGFNTMREDSLLLSLYPHMHVRGKAFKYIAQYADGREEVLLDVPRYDFNWQNSYLLEEPKFLPKGTKIKAIAHYDNSTENLNNPDPAKVVTFGEQTWEEMMIGFFDVVNVDDAKKERILSRIRSQKDQPLARARETEESISEKTAVGQAADKPAGAARPKPDHQANAEEKRAEGLLKQARLLSKQNPRKAREYAQRVIDLAPESNVAAQAAELIDALTPK